MRPGLHRRSNADGVIGRLVRGAGGAPPGRSRRSRVCAQGVRFSRRLAAAVGLLVVGIAIVSAAAISIGSAGYLGVFIALPQPLLVIAIVLAMGLVAAWGVRESVSFAAAMTLIEVAGLVVLIAAGATSGPTDNTAAGGHSAARRPQRTRRHHGNGPAGGVRIHRI